MLYSEQLKKHVTEYTTRLRNRKNYVYNETTKENISECLNTYGLTTAAEKTTERATPGQIQES